MIRVLVVDDSAFMRKALSLMLEKDPEIRVVGTACDGEEALRLVAELDPDVVTMDVEMPRMDGLTALRHLMRRAPRPVLMVSSLTREGAATTVEALALGAVDFIPKEHARVSVSIMEAEGELHRKVKAMAGARPRAWQARADRAEPPPTRTPPSAPDPGPPLRFSRAGVLVVGVSTGGPFALQEVVPALPASFPVPVVIVQHMPPHFTRSLAQRLDALSALEVREAEEGMRVEPGRVIIARGGEHLALRRSRLSDAVTVALSSEPAGLLHRPSVDVLFHSAAEVVGPRALALVMTGMGKDGLEGARAIHQAGGAVLAQDEASSVVYGMPRAVIEAGIARAALPLDRLATALTSALDRTPHVAAARG